MLFCIFVCTYFRQTLHVNICIMSVHICICVHTFILNCMRTFVSADMAITLSRMSSSDISEAVAWVAC